MPGPTLISRIVPRVSRTLFKKDRSKARLSMARLADAWSEIIAPEDPFRILPVRVGWKTEGEGPARISRGTLHVIAPSAMAQKLLFQEKVIVERVNRLFGLSGPVTVVRISITHDPMAVSSKIRRKAAVAVGEDTQGLIDGIDDPVLKERLAGLAKAMAGDGRS